MWGLLCKCQWKNPTSKPTYHLESGWSSKVLFPSPASILNTGISSAVWRLTEWCLCLLSFFPGTCLTKRIRFVIWPKLCLSLKGLLSSPTRKLCLWRVPTPVCKAIRKGVRLAWKLRRYSREWLFASWPWLGMATARS